MTIRVVYIAGSGRSGSTVFELALAQRLGVPGTGELVSVWTRGVIEDRDCSCGAPFSRCSFWQAVVATDPTMFTSDMAERVIGHSARVLAAFGPLRCLTRARRTRLVEMVDPEWYEAMGALYRGVAEVTGSAVFTDSSKAPVLAVLLSQIDGLRIDVVHLVRDPRSVARSWSRPHPVPPGTATMPHLAPWKAAVVWSMVNEATLRASGSLPGAYVRARYEDFAGAPSFVLDDVARALGSGAGGREPPGRHPAEPRPGAGVATDDVYVEPAEHTMSGNPPVRLRREAFAVTPIPGDQSGSARASDLVTTVLTLPWLRRYRYHLRPDRLS